MKSFGCSGKTAQSDDETQKEPLTHWHPDAQAALPRLQVHRERLAKDGDALAASAERFAECSLHRVFSCPATTGDGDTGSGGAGCGGELLADWSREPLDRAAWDELLSLPDAVQLRDWIERLFAGNILNLSEGMAALAPACRAAGETLTANAGRPKIDTQTADTQTADTLQAMLEFAEDFRSGRICGGSGEPLRTLVNIGIGGSDQGVRLIHSAFADRLPDGVQVVFACCEEELQQLLPSLRAEQTLLLLNSKSFTTVEVLNTAARAKQWLQDSLGDTVSAAHLSASHWAAATSWPERAAAQGVPAERIFAVPDGVGGRYSLWSAAGLAAAVVLGRQGFLQLLAGGRQADTDLRTQPWADNLAVRLALKDLWHQGVERRATRLLLPYALPLANLPDYLGQLEMESLGKSLSADGKRAVEHSGQMLWGGFGPRAQHGFYQLLYEGTHRPQLEMLAVAADPATDMGYAQCLAQAQALSSGIPTDDSGTASARPLPVTLLVLGALNPCSLGFLLALWEHRVFVQSRILDVNPFDQPGVEYGKQITANLQKNDWRADHPSTAALAEYGRTRSKANER